MFETTEFRGNPIIILKRDDKDKFPFQFGLSKAKLILQHIQQIQDFVQHYTAEQPPEPPQGEQSDEQQP